MDIIKIIQQTATWIEKVNKNYEANLYRSPELITDRHFIHIPSDQQHTAINAINKKRAVLLENAGVSLIPVDELPNFGRLMFFDVNSTVCDGAPQDVSKYYIDINDAPPMDTWIALGSQLDDIGVIKESDHFLKESIIAWVPESQYFYANEAVLVACVDNFAWANPNWLTDAYTDLKEIFSPPDNFQVPEYPMDLVRRTQLMREFEDELDKK